METSKIKIRPFVPCLKNEEEEGREEYAVLKYGNIEIELDQTIMEYLKIDCGADSFTKTVSIAGAAFAEIIREMYVKNTGKLPAHHRDTESNYVQSITHNHLHPSNTENIKI